MYIKNISEAKKESFSILKTEAERCLEQLNDIIEKQKDKLEAFANNFSDKIGGYMNEFEKYAFKNPF